MGFWGINEQNRQRINLSAHADALISRDVKEFNQKSKNELINRIILYNEKYNLTKEYELHEYSKKEQKTLEKIEGISDITNIVRQLTEIKRKEIIQSLEASKTHKRNHIGQYIRISNAARKWLESPSNHENEFYTSLEHYLNTILEEYARKTTYERELIIFDPVLDHLNDCKGNWVSMYSPYNSSPRYIYPVEILPDDNKQHSYMSCLQTDDWISIHAAVYRISRLPDPDDIRVIYNNLSISDDDLITLKQKIEENGIMFLTDTATDISVRFTDEGIRTYNRTSHLRPKLISINEDDPAIYTFHCTERQAEWYFIRFANEAEILYPQTLRDKLHKRFTSAAATYNS